MSYLDYEYTPSSSTQAAQSSVAASVGV